MSLPFSQGKLQGKERKNVLQSVQEQAKAVARAAIRPVLQEFLETEVCAKLGREKGEARHISSQPREIDWQCGHCGCQDASQFTRDGHYRQGLSRGWGHLSDLRVPMLECQQCQHDVVTQFTILEKYKQFWMDLDQDVLFGSGFCESLRHLMEWGKQWREQAPQSVATLECDFEQTLAFYALSGLTLEWIRTTSLLERTNRELRRKFCQVVTFGSHKGAEVAVYRQVQRLYARWSGESWWDTSHALYFELRNLHS